MEGEKKGKTTRHIEWKIKLPTVLAGKRTGKNWGERGIYGTKGIRRGGTRHRAVLGEGDPFSPRAPGEELDANWVSHYNRVVTGWKKNTTINRIEKNGGRKRSERIAHQKDGDGYLPEPKRKRMESVDRPLNRLKELTFGQA